MKNLLYFFLATCLMACSQASYKVVSNISNGTSYESDLWEDKTELVELKNKRLSIPLEIKVRKKSDSTFVRGFGLKGLKKQQVLVEKDCFLQITNSSKRCAKVKFTGEVVAETNLTENNNKAQNAKIRFYLLNDSPTSIPLIIPTVMNPNLSPMSSSGVDLKIGQEIFFKHRGKKYLLLKVSDKIKEGDKIKVNELLQERKKELGLK